MNIAVVYIYPMANIRKYYALAKRFGDTYRQFPGGDHHDLYVISNGANASDFDRRALSGVDCIWLAYNNIGWDIGAFQWAADTVPCDLMFCMGANCHFHREGWLKRAMEVYLENGVGLYGCTAYDGPMTHVRTTIFWCPPELIQSYPNIAGSTKRSRYDFEHGKNSITMHLKKMGVPCFMVTWDNVFAMGDWHNHTPTPDNILVRDQFIHLPGSTLDR